MLQAAGGGGGAEPLHMGTTAPSSWLRRCRGYVWRLFLALVLPTLWWLVRFVVRWRRALDRLASHTVHATLLSPSTDNPGAAMTASATAAALAAAAAGIAPAGGLTPYHSQRVEKRSLFELDLNAVLRHRGSAVRLLDAAAMTTPSQPIVTRHLRPSEARQALNAVLKQLSVLFAKELLQADGGGAGGGVCGGGGSSCGGGGDGSSGSGGGAWYLIALVNVPYLVSQCEEEERGSGGRQEQQQQQQQQQAGGLLWSDALAAGAAAKALPATARAAAQSLLRGVHGRHTQGERAANEMVAGRPRLQALVVEEEKLQRICKGLLLQARPLTFAEVTAEPQRSSGGIAEHGMTDASFAQRLATITAAPPIFPPPSAAWSQTTSAAQVQRSGAAAPQPPPRQQQQQQQQQQQEQQQVPFLAERQRVRWALLSHLASAYLEQTGGGREQPTGSFGRIDGALAPEGGLHLLRVQLPIRKDRATFFPSANTAAVGTTAEAVASVSAVTAASAAASAAAALPPRPPAAGAPPRAEAHGCNSASTIQYPFARVVFPASSARAALAAVCVDLVGGSRTALTQGASKGKRKAGSPQMVPLVDHGSLPGSEPSSPKWGFYPLTDEEDVDPWGEEVQGELPPSAPQSGRTSPECADHEQPS